MTDQKTTTGATSENGATLEVDKPNPKIKSLKVNTARELYAALDFELAHMAEGNYEYVAGLGGITETDRALGKSHIIKLAEKHFATHIEDVVAIGDANTLAVMLHYVTAAQKKLGRLQAALAALKEVSV